MGAGAFSVSSAQMPGYLSAFANWVLWRLTYGGGEIYRNRYLKKFDTREDMGDFIRRREMTPIPNPCRTAINEIRNAIFSRLSDVSRSGGSLSYQNAIAGLNGGVDHRGSTMSVFLGIKVLSELLSMGRVGIYVDHPMDIGPTLQDIQGVTPYLYVFPLESIFSYTNNRPAFPSEFQSVLLRETVMGYDWPSGLPIAEVVRYRRMWINKETGFVNLQYYQSNGVPIEPDGTPSPTGERPLELKIKRIPFVLLDIGESLLKDAAHAQIAMLNLTSSDVNYALRSNFPFLTKQEDMRAAGSHLKQFDTGDDSPEAGGQPSASKDQKVGVTHGMIYDKETERPAFINPSSEPLKASLMLQEKLEADIRKCVNLAVQTLSTRASAESKQLDNQGLEGGLSYIGLELENAERLISEYWAAYESVKPEGRQIATVKYPDRYSIKTDNDRVEESNKLSGLMSKVPGPTVKREIAKEIVNTLLGGKIPVTTLQKIRDEIDSVPYTTSDANVVIQAVTAGIMSPETGSLAIGCNAGEEKKAEAASIRRARAIATAQGVTQSNEQTPGIYDPNDPTQRKENDPASRGVPDLSATLERPEVINSDDSADSLVDPGLDETMVRTASQSPDIAVNGRPPKRGKGKKPIKKYDPADAAPLNAGTLKDLSQRAPFK